MQSSTKPVTVPVSALESHPPDITFSVRKWNGLSGGNKPWVKWFLGGATNHGSNGFLGGGNKSHGGWWELYYSVTLWFKTDAHRCVSLNSKKQYQVKILGIGQITNKSIKFDTGERKFSPWTSHLGIRIIWIKWDPPVGGQNAERPSQSLTPEELWPHSVWTDRNSHSPDPLRACSHRTRKLNIAHKFVRKPFWCCLQIVWTLPLTNVFH